MKNLINLKKYGFVVSNNKRSFFSSSKPVLVRKSVAEALLKAKSFLPENHNFKVSEGFRSVEEQRKIVESCERRFKKQYPKNWHNMLVRYTGGYKVLDEKPCPGSHMGGGAVDLTLVKGNRELEMGGITFDERDNLNYYEKKKRLTKKEKEIKESRRILKKAMRKAGFKAYIPEWWHWGYKD